MTTSTDTDQFEVLHALRVKGLASDEILAALTGLDAERLSATVSALVDAGWAVRRDGRMAGTMLNAAGKEQYTQARASFTLGDDERRAVEQLYDGFIPINADFKRICAAWQMRDETTPNDHTDADYDAGVIGDLDEAHGRVTAIITPAGQVMPRWSRYTGRLSGALDKVKGGDTAAFARPMYDSYHDIWMELHQDLLLTAGRERGADDEK